MDFISDPIILGIIFGIIILYTFISLLRGIHNELKRIVDILEKKV